MMIGRANLGSISLRPSCMTAHLHLWLRIQPRAAEGDFKSLLERPSWYSVLQHVILWTSAPNLPSTAQLTLAAGIQSVLSFSRDQLEHETLFVDSSVCPGWHCTYPSRRRLIPLAVCIQILTFLNRSTINYLVRIMYLSNHLILLS